MFKILADGVESARELVWLLRSAREAVYYSSFICDVGAALPGCGGLTMKLLFKELVARGVRVHVLYTEEYSKVSVEDFCKCVPGVRVREVVGDGRLPVVARLMGRNTRYSNHHQKYLCVDAALMMVGGTDVDSQRTGWRGRSAKHAYSWHETSVVVPCSRRMWSFVESNFNRAVGVRPPFPLVRGGMEEHRLLLHLIDSARSCIHMEAQTCISSGSTGNSVLTAVAARVERAYRHGDRFHFMLLTNEWQEDESGVVSWMSHLMLSWSLQHLYGELSRRGVPVEFVAARVFVGCLRDGSRHIKVHSNMVLQDGHTLLRSSSNFTDRSLSVFPCDLELGVVVSGERVARFQQKLWGRYLCVRRAITPEAALAGMCREEGVVRRVAWGDVASVLMDVVHCLVFFGGKRHIKWQLVKK